MLMGVFFHASIAFMHTDIFWAVKSPEASIWAELLVRITHGFRMHCFFILSGFFTAMLSTKYNIKDFIVNRWQRIVIPFVVSSFLLLPILNYLWYPINIDKTFGHGYYSIAAIFQSVMWFDNQNYFYHLWFLQYLIAFYLISPLFHLKLSLMNQGNSIKYFIIFFLVSLSPYVFSGLWEPEAPYSIIPKLRLIIFYGSFYFFGYWFFFNQKILNSLISRIKLLFSTSILSGIIYLAIFIIDNHFSWNSGVLKSFSMVFLNLYAWAMSLSLISFFKLKFDKKNKLTRFLVDSSYWVYVMHLPIVVLLQKILQANSLSNFTNFILINLISILVLYSTYYVFGKNTFLGTKRKYEAC